MSGFLRNLLLNLVLGVLSTLCVLATFHALIAIEVADFTVNGESDWLGAITLFLFFFALSALSVLLTLQSYDVRALKGQDRNDARTKLVMLFNRRPRWIVVVPLSLSLIAGSVWICINLKSIGLKEVGLTIAVAVVSIGLGWECAYVLLQYRRIRHASKISKAFIFLKLGARRAIRDSRNELRRYVLAILVCGLAAYCLLLTGSSFLRLSGLDAESAIHVIALGPAVGVVLFWFLFVLWMGIVGNTYSEFTREWLNRFLGELSGFAGLWIIAGSLILYARPVWRWGSANTYTFVQNYQLATAGFVGAAVLVASVAQLRKSKRMYSESEAETKRPILMALCWLSVCGFIAAVTVVFQDVFLSVFAKLHSGASRDTFAEILNGQIADLADVFSFRRPKLASPISWLFAMPAITTFFVVGALAICAFVCVDVNTFSLQNLYRNRLVRCYLGAAHGASRLPNPYAGFDPRDDFALHEFANQRPYLLMNAALNITQGQDLAWQQRKAAAFVFSPRWCGYWLESTEMSRITGGLTRGGYVRTDQYVVEPGAFRRDSEGVMVGTAIATSGAAVSSQMGFASRGPLAFALTLLNLRLGRWLPNTARKTEAPLWKKSSPGFGAFWYLRELLGTTNERSSWVYVSDGGHFENLGVYELVRRRCTRIFCVDAGADPNRTFSDLGNAVQKCRVDLGVDIRIDLGALQVDAKGVSEEAFTIGTIEYPALGNEKGFRGELVYVKPSLPRSWEYLPTDILAYRARHPEFPHEPTTNQWFSESQFESYRHLGYVIGLRALSATDGWRGPRGTRSKKTNRASGEERPSA